MFRLFRFRKKEANHEKVLKKQHKKYKKFTGDYSSHADLGRKLHDYHRIDSFIKKTFPNGITGKKIVHLGSGNTIYCDYLVKKGAKAFAVDTNKSYLTRAHNLGSKAFKVNSDAHTIKLRKESIDIFLSDHFLFSNYGIRDYDIVNHILPALKKDGLLIMERTELTNGCLNWLKDIGLVLIESDTDKQKNKDFVGKEFFVFRKN